MLAYQTGQENVAVANESNLSEVMEMFITKSFYNLKNQYQYIFPYVYDEALNTQQKRFKQPISSTSHQDGKTFTYNRERMTFRSSLTPWGKIRRKMFDTLTSPSYVHYLARKMAQGERNDGDKVPMMVAMMDSIGIAAELSHWSNSGIHELKTVLDERQWQNTSCSSISLLEDMIRGRENAKREKDYENYVYKKNQQFIDDAKNFKSVMETSEKNYDAIISIAAMRLPKTNDDYLLALRIDTILRAEKKLTIQQSI